MMWCYVVKIKYFNLENTVVSTETQICNGYNGGQLENKKQVKHQQTQQLLFRIIKFLIIYLIISLIGVKQYAFLTIRYISLILFTILFIWAVLKKIAPTAIAV
jgi:hypothetical protein